MLAVNLINPIILELKQKRLKSLKQFCNANDVKDSDIPNIAEIKILSA